METIKLEASPRLIIGKKVKELRRQGLTPIHIYGRKTESQFLQTDTKSLQKIIRRVGKNIPVSIIDSENSSENTNLSFVREIQIHPVNGQLLHVDFYQVDISERIKAEVPVILVGEAPAVKMYRGVLFQPRHRLEVESLPMDVPESFELDISILDDFEKAIRVSDISIPENVEILADTDDIIVRVNQPRVEAEEVPGDTEEGVEPEVIGESDDSEEDTKQTEEAEA